FKGPCGSSGHLVCRLCLFFFFFECLRKNDVVNRTFDNGMICATENSVVVDEEIYDKVKEEL
ncbi:hypothetical protein, partial [Limosilactobacillus reuteri]|uniref:hypothetical protein n=1 Tax=Limosilactobacillus reuteri TaxID=1598 RepID=UPI001CDC0D56